LKEFKIRVVVGLPVIGRCVKPDVNAGVVVTADYRWRELLAINFAADGCPAFSVFGIIESIVQVVAGDFQE
jgi:hypothetical protein